MNAAASPVAARRRSALTGKMVMSLLGVVPLGVYVVLHLWTNMHSVLGEEAFDAALKASREKPAFLFLEIVGLGLPILIHTLIGLGIIVKMRPNNVRYGYFRNLRYLLQRLSALGVLLFLGAHVVKARIMPATQGTHETWRGMHEALSEPVTFTVYALGLLGVSYHLANGLWGSALTFGLTVGPRAQTRMQWIALFTFFLLMAMSTIAVWGFQPFQP
jgi:succinate dehydrogenase / fumarate reductase cytochrome b subunit